MKVNVFRQLAAVREQVTADNKAKEESGTLELIDMVRAEAIRAVFLFINSSRFCKTKSSREFIETIGMTDSAAAEKLGLSKNTVRAKRYQYGAKLKAVFGESLCTDLQFGDVRVLTRIKYCLEYEFFYRDGNFLLPRLQDAALYECKDYAGENYVLQDCKTALLVLAFFDKYFLDQLLCPLDSTDKKKLMYLINSVNSGDQELRMKVCYAMMAMQGRIRKQVFNWRVTPTQGVKRND